ncbi:filamentous hemagglutinin N-terminal domain-containing protein, partial [Microcoleus sp. C2C6]|uniref:two-partner secretion domain-containing protein n=1 Tax=Microcoleus sp. C2C6 TaxID=3055325 RepID=UPI002FD33B73
MTANRLPLLGWLFILGWLSAAAGSASAQPITSAADGTNTVVTPNGNRYDISGGSLSPEQANLFHSFTEFGLSEGQTANFLTNPNIQNILGRITGGNPSLINGLIQVIGGNSNLFLMNPAGMIFGPSSSLNVPGSFNATTATGIGFGNNQWFSAMGNNNWATLIGTPNSFALTNLPGGSIVNAGNLTVTPGQSLTLVGGTVVNTGQLNAPSGNILLSAVPGNNLVRISQAGNLLSLDIQPTATQSSLPNNWTQPVLSLPQLLTGKGAAQATSLTVNPNGEVVLTGNVAVPVTAGTTIASGTLNVSGDIGGNVNLLGEKVGVIAGNINASGINGGGNVLIGGDYQGLGTVPNALRTFVSSDSTINADAVSNGQGGRVIVWADETTRFQGNITARGGLFSGNGGFAEVSGKQSLDFQGLVDLRSTFGIAGTLLLDPTDITISAGGDAGGTLAAGAFTPSAGTSTIKNVTLQNQLGLGNVTISTASNSPNPGDITVSAPVVWANSNSLTLNADYDINVKVDSNITTTQGGNITLNAANNIQVNSDITTQGGNITLNADSDQNGGSLQIQASTIDTNGGNFLGNGQGGATFGIGIEIEDSTINAGGGKIDLNGVAGNAATNFGIALYGSTLQTTGSGNITLNGTNGGSVNSSGIVLRGPTISSVNGDITLTGSGNGSGEAIYLFSSAVVESTGTGSITMIGTGTNPTAGSNQGSNEGIIVTNTSKVISTNGAVSLTGIGNGTGNDSNGIEISDNSIVESIGAGNVTLTGTGGNGTYNNKGISINTSTVQSAGGNVSLTGTGAGKEFNNTGVSIDTATVQSTPGNGTVTITGTGGNGTSSNQGISIESSTVRSENGDIALTGTGKGTEDNNTGISMTFGAVESTGTGNLTLSGVGSNNGIDSSQGISVLGATVEASSGNVTLTGTGGGTGTSNEGIYVDSNATIQTAQLGKVTLTGTGSAGTGTNSGIRLNSGTVRSENGDIALIGTGLGTSINNDGITLDSSESTTTVEATGKGNISLTGKASYSSINLIGSVIDAPLGGNVTLTGDSIQLSPQTQVKGTGTIQLQPLTPSLDISVGGNMTDARLNLSSEEVTFPILDGFSQLIIGRADGTGAIAVDPAGVTFQSPTTIQPPTGTGSIAVNGPIKANGGITFNGATSLSADVTTSDKNITFNSPVTVENKVNLNTGTGAGNILFQETVDGTTTNTNSQDLTLAVGSGNITFGRDAGSVTPLGNLKINSAGNLQTKAITAASIIQNVLATGTVTISGDLTATNGDIRFENPVEFNNVSTNNVYFTANKPGTTGLETGRITLNNGFVAGSNSLTITSDEIDIIGLSSSGTGDLVLQPFRPDLKIALGVSSDRSDSLDMTGLFNRLDNGFKSIAIGRTDSSGAITIESPLTFQEPVTIRSPQGAGSIAILPGGSLTGLDNASIALTANQNITAGNITASGSGDITLTSNIGTIALNGPITTIDQNITFNGPVTLQNNVLVDTGAAGGGSILFSSTLNGTTANNQDLTLTAGTGNITVKGEVGNPIPIGNLQINSASDVQTAAITANSITQTAGTGTTAFKGPVTTNAAGGLNLTGTNFAIDNPVTTLNNGNFTVNNSGDLNIATAANLVLDGEFTQSGTGKVNIASNITTTNDNISFNSPVTLTNDVSFNTGAGAGDITFNNTVDSTTANSPNLTLTAGTGNIAFTTGAIGNSTTPFGAIAANSSGTTSFASTVNAQSLTTDLGGTTKLNGNVTTTGSQTYGDAVTIANNPILSGSDITFNNTVDGSSDLTVNGGSSNVTFNGAVGNPTNAIGKLTANSTGTTAFNQTVNAASLTTDAGGTTKLNGNVTTTGSQTYGDAVTIANNSILSGSDITFNNTVDGSSDLTVNGGSSNVTFNGAVGAESAIGKITANSIGTTAFNQTVNAASLTTDAGGTTQVK